MEDFDEDGDPSATGALDLSHRAWKVLDKNIWDWGTKLLVLDISYNRLDALPMELGQLTMLQELNAACNTIERVTPMVGRCLRLKVLKLNGNHLTELPEDVRTAAVRNDRFRESTRPPGALLTDCALPPPSLSRLSAPTFRSCSPLPPNLHHRRLTTVRSGTAAFSRISSSARTHW